MVDSGHFDGFRTPLSSASFCIYLFITYFQKATEDRSPADTVIFPMLPSSRAPPGKCTNYIDLEIPYLFINFTTYLNHKYLMKRFTAYLTVLLPAIISLCLSSCNVTYRTSMPSMPWKMAADSIKPDIPPKFNGGDPKVEFPQWVYQNLHFPEEARKANASGTALVEFAVNPDGTVSDINVQESPHASITEEIIRVFSESPLWTPAYLDGKPIKVVYTMPLAFRFRDSSPRIPNRPQF